MAIPSLRDGWLRLEEAHYAKIPLLTTDDFRIPVATHCQLLLHQLCLADSGPEHSLRKHCNQPIWGEVLAGDYTAVPEAHPRSRTRTRNTVTAYVGSLFEWIFGDRIQVIEPDSGRHETLDGSINDDDPTPDGFRRKVPSLSKLYTFHHLEYQNAVYPRFTTRTTGTVKVGDVIELPRDDKTKWTGTEKWYAFVRDRLTTPQSLVNLKIIWLYFPQDVALCKSMKYPYSNEVKSHLLESKASYFLVIIARAAKLFVLMKLYARLQWNSSVLMEYPKINVILKSIG
jgi:hypothetical protein